jgi:biotin-dependent carboxylase-like uncharacterized protein
MIKDPAYLKIMKTGPGTSIQDLGRIGFSQFGVPYSGAMDLKAFSWINHLLKNKADDAVLEISQPGFKAEFDAPTLICLAGAKADCNLNAKPVSSFGLIPIQEGDTIEIGGLLLGSILYLGIKGGFQTAEILESKSWYQGITAESTVRKNALIPYFTSQEIPSFTNSKAKWNTSRFETETIKAYPGPDWKLLDEKSQKQLSEGSFTISNLKNRMAIQLEELLPNSLPELATAPVFPGTVQLTSGGKLIILMRDAQVTGGYPRILQFPEESLSVLAQKKPYQKINFSFLEV